jgi:hypothetical protein
LIIANLSLNVLLLDFIRAIQEGVEADSHRRHLQNPTDYPHRWVSARTQRLDQWSSSDEPWSMAGSHFSSLIQALTGDLRSSQLRLPGLDVNAQIAVKHVWCALAKRIHSDDTSVSAGPPLVRQGAFQTILPTVYHLITSLAPYPEEDSKVEWFANAFQIVMQVRKVEFLPWKRDTAPSHTYVTSDTFINCMGQPTVASTSSSSQPSTSSSSSQVQITPQLGGTWMVSNHSLRSLMSYAFHTRLPSDLTASTWPRSPQPIIRETVQWIETNYNQANPLHHLSLLAALFISRLAPFYQFSTKVVQPHGDSPSSMQYELCRGIKIQRRLQVVAQDLHRWPFG